MRQPREPGVRELQILAKYLQCQHNFLLSPRDFYSKWLVTQEMIARICLCSQVTVERWFATGKNFREAEVVYQQRLAQVDFLWDHFDEFPRQWRRLFCQPLQQPQKQDPSS
jgi:hypothetical protein